MFVQIHNALDEITYELHRVGWNLNIENDAIEYKIEYKMYAKEYKIVIKADYQVQYCGISNNEKLLVNQFHYIPIHIRFTYISKAIANRLCFNNSYVFNFLIT